MFGEVVKLVCLFLTVTVSGALYERSSSHSVSRQITSPSTKRIKGVPLTRGDTLYSFEVAVAPPMLNSATSNFHFLPPIAIQNW